jgi:PilZ domain
MYDNSSLEIRCRSLWADILCAVESRVWSINDYVRGSKSELNCQMLGSNSVQIEHLSGKRTLIATLDLVEHAIHIKEFQDGALTVGSKLLFALLGDGNIYVTHGRTLLGDPMAVARQLMSVLLSNSLAPSTSDVQIDQYRSWASAIITPRLQRMPITLPIEIQTADALFPGSTVDLSPVGLKVQAEAALDRGNYVTVFRGTFGSFFRVVWSEKTEDGTLAGLVCLNPPLEWAEEMAV